jgi:hypothetical protein
MHHKVIGICFSWAIQEADATIARRLDQDFHYILMKSGGLGGTLDRRGLCVWVRKFGQRVLAAAAGDLLGERARARWL